MRAFQQAQAQLLSEVESELGSDLESELESDSPQQQECQPVFASLVPSLGGSCPLTPSRSWLPSQLLRPGIECSSGSLGVESGEANEIEALTRHLIFAVYEKPLDDREVLAAVAACPELAWLAECSSKTPLHGWSKLPLPRTALANQTPMYQCDKTNATCETPPLFNFFVRLGRLIAHSRQSPGEAAAALQGVNALAEEAKAEATSSESLWTGPHVDPTSGAEFFHCPSSGASAWEFPGKGPLFVAHVAESLFGAESFARASSSVPSTCLPASSCWTPKKQQGDLLDSSFEEAESDADSFYTPNAGRKYDLSKSHWDSEQKDAQPALKMKVDMDWEVLKKLLIGSACAEAKSTDDAVEASLASELVSPATGMSPLPQLSMAQAAVALSAARVTDVPGEASGSLQGTWAATVQALTIKGQARQIQADLCQDTMLTWAADEIATCPADALPTSATSLKGCDKLEAEGNSAKHLSVVPMDGDSLEVVDCYLSDAESDTPMLSCKSDSIDSAESDAAAEVRALRSTVSKLAEQVAELQGQPPSLSGQTSPSSSADMTALWQAMAALQSKIRSRELPAVSSALARAQKPPRRGELEAVLRSRRRDVDQHGELFESEDAANAQTAPSLSWQLMPMQAVAS